MTIRYFFLYLLKSQRFKALQISGGLCTCSPAKIPYQRTSAKPLPVFQPRMFTFIFAAKDKSNNGDINHMIVSYQPGNKAMKPELL